MYQLRIFFSALLICYLIESVWSQTNYCVPSLCRGRRHIACRNNQAFGRACSRDARIIPTTINFRRQLVRIHNSIRNRVARGNVNGYQPAIRMATMSWNPELARLAMLHVKQCVLRHDQCRNTQMYLFSGQNGGRTRWSDGSRSVLNVATNLIISWFRQSRRCNMQQIGNLTTAITRQCGQFTTMIQEKNNAVGCSILRQRRNGENYQYMTCNYAYNNINNRAVYRSGTVVANCTTGTNPQFPALCSIRETYRLRSTDD